jgi:Tol biopolymer transport system component
LLDEKPVIRSTGRERSPVYSPDGTKIVDVSDQTEGDDEIFVQDADGKNRVQVTHKKVGVGFVRWSPDGKQVIFDVGSDHGPEVYLMGAVAGAQPARVLLNARNASMSHNGKWLYFQSRGEIYKATSAGGSPQALTKMRGEQPVESADGKFLIFRARNSLWRVPVDGGEEEEFIVPDHDLLWGTTIQPVKKGVYFLEWERAARPKDRNKGGNDRRFRGGGGQMVVSFYDYATKANTVAVRMKNSEMNGRMDGAFSVSPDGKYILYPKVDRSQTNVMLVENFK